MLMIFLNKKTGLQWEISDASLIDRLKNNPDYEVVIENDHAVDKEQPKASTVKEKSSSK